MLQNEKEKIDIEIDFNTLSSNNIADIINNILQFLLHQRYQIPFNYLTFGSLVDSFMQRSETELDKFTHLTKFDIEKQRRQATDTKDAIEEMKMLCTMVLESHIVRTVRFLFGATTFMPKEVYTIHLPFEFLSRQAQRQPLSAFVLNEIMLKLITNEHLCNVFANTLNITNLYVDMEVVEILKLEPSTILPKCMQNKPIVQLPQSCKQIHFHFVHKPVIPIYEDPNPVVHNNDDTDIENQTISMDWWEASTIVRGFKQKSNQKISIW